MIKMKKKIFLTLVFCAFIGAFITSCSKAPEEFSSPPPNYAPVLAVSFNGEEIGFTSADITPKELETLICDLKSTELSESGAEVKSIELEQELTFASTEASKEEIISGQDLAGAVFRKNPIFKVTLIEREEKVLEFETVYQKSSSHYEGTSVTKTEGKNGLSSLTYEIVYSGSTQIAKTLVEEKVVSNSQSKVVLVGTKKSTASTGVYGYPLKSMYVTSSYGGRTLNGKYDFHYGVDLRASTGTSVYASDGGKIIYAGTLGTYGKLVKIEHDNGDVTYYAHLSSISVKVGDRVYKGQVIAKSGATGNVTGPHLHFELRINGKHTNPMKYVKS